MKMKWVLAILLSVLLTGCSSITNLSPNQSVPAGKSLVFGRIIIKNPEELNGATLSLYFQDIKERNSISVAKTAGQKEYFVFSLPPGRYKTSGLYHTSAGLLGTGFAHEDHKMEYENYFDVPASSAVYFGTLELEKTLVQKRLWATQTIGFNLRLLSEKDAVVNMLKQDGYDLGDNIIEASLSEHE